VTARPRALLARARRGLPRTPAQIIALATLAAVLATLWLQQPAGTSRRLTGLALVAFALTVLVSSRTWSRPFWRRFGGPVAAVTLGLLVTVTGGSDSYYRDALLAIPIVSAIVLSSRQTVVNLVLALAVAAAPALYETTADAFLPDLLADGILWSGITLAVHTQTARLRRQRRELQVLDELKSDFLESVSHQVRTPLTGILGAAVTLDRHHDALDAGRQRAMVGVIRRHAVRLDSLVENILDVAGLSAGQVSVKAEPVDLGWVVRDALAAADAGERQVTVSVPEVSVPADRRQLRRAFFNVIDNAFRHTPDGTRVDIIGQVHDPAVLVIVADRGPGIPREIVETLFEPFTRGPIDGDPNPGVGTGLTIARGVVELHGGRISVEPRPGGGSMFMIELPTALAPSRPRQEPDRQAPKTT
jgi:signal transduction histidine kinase